jgi:glycosyltransferase involved in cell wall biosynthesis
LNRYALAAADAVTVVGPELEHRALGLGVPRDRLHHLPMGIDVATRFVAAATSAAASAPILFVGRLVPEKGADLAIRALPSVVKYHPDAHMEIIGDGPQRGSLDILVERLGLTGRVRFVGALPPDQLSPRYRAASVCVVPSRSEGFGLVALEAMASARPVILSDLPSLRRISMDGDVADLVPPDDADALAAAITRLLGDRARRDLFGARGRTRAESYSWDVAANGYAELIDRLAGEYSERTDG